MTGAKNDIEKIKNRKQRPNIAQNFLLLLKKEMK